MGTQAASLDIAKAYRNSPITPTNKKYLCVYWKDSVYIQHIAIEGLATAGGIQGSVADATVAILKVNDVEPIVKWVDDFVFFRSPLITTTHSLEPSFKFNLQDILDVTAPLGIPWHPFLAKATISNPPSLMLASNGTCPRVWFLFPQKNTFIYSAKYQQFFQNPMRASTGRQSHPFMDPFNT